jgi:ABC-type branched-subunit amino acid transport system ATPase component
MSPEPEAPAASPDLLLEATGVVAGYVPEVNILNGLDLTLAHGEFVGIIGPNGAGKSTFLKAVLGLVPVREGTVLFQGEDITGHRADQLVKKGVGFVPQTRNVFPSLTVTENLEMGAYLDPSKFKEQVEYVYTLFPRASARWWRWGEP